MVIEAYLPAELGDEELAGHRRRRRGRQRRRLLHAGHGRGHARGHGSRGGTGRWPACRPSCASGWPAECPELVSSQTRLHRPDHPAGTLASTELTTQDIRPARSQQLGRGRPVHEHLVEGRAQADRERAGRARRPLRGSRSRASGDSAATRGGGGRISFEQQIAVRADPLRRARRAVNVRQPRRAV